MNLVVIQNEVLLLKEWLKTIKMFEESHRKACTHYKRLNSIIMLPIIVLNGLSGIIGFANINTTDDKTDTSVVNSHSIAIGVIGVTAAVLTTIYNFLSIPGNVEKHEHHTIEYNKLAREISTNLILYNTNDKIYANLAEFIKYCRYRIDKLKDSSPPIPEFIYKKYVNIDERNAINLEDDYIFKQGMACDKYDNAKQNDENETICDNVDINGIDIDVQTYDMNIKADTINISENNVKQRPNSFETFRIYMKKN